MAKQKMLLLAKCCARKRLNVSGLTGIRRSIAFSRQAWVTKQEKSWEELLGQDFVLVSEQALLLLGKLQ